MGTVSGNHRHRQTYCDGYFLNDYFHLLRRFIIVAIDDIATVTNHWNNSYCDTVVVATPFDYLLQLFHYLLEHLFSSIAMTLNRCISIYCNSFVILLQRFINYNTIYTHQKTKSFINNLIIQNMQQASNLNPKAKCNQVQNDQLSFYSVASSSHDKFQKIQHKTIDIRAFIHNPKIFSSKVNIFIIFFISFFILDTNKKRTKNINQHLNDNIKRTIPQQNKYVNHI